MRVKGHDIPATTGGLALARFGLGVPFTFNELRQLLESEFAVPSRDQVSDRAADRILQSARRAGAVVHASRSWRRTR